MPKSNFLSVLLLYLLSCSLASAAPDIMVSVGTTNFGHKVISEGQTRWRPGLISNGGDTELHFSEDAITIEGRDADDFVLSSTITAATILAPASTNVLPFQIAFHPTSTGLKQATLKISSNDPITPNLIYALSGEGLEDRGTTVSGPYTGYGPGESTIGIGGDYPSLFHATEDIGKYPLTGGSWTFKIITDLQETTGSLLGQYDTNGHYLIFKPAPGTNPTVNFTGNAPQFIMPWLDGGYFVIGASNAPNPTLSGNMVPTSNVVLDGANTLNSDRGLHFTCMANFGLPLIYLVGDADNFMLRNCTVSTQSNGNSGFAAFAINYRAETPNEVPDNLTIENCEISAIGPTQAAAIANLRGRTITSTPPRNITIRGNKVRSNLKGIGVFISPSAEVTSNDVTIDQIPQYGSEAYGIASICAGETSTSPTTKIIGNAVRFLGSSRAIRAAGIVVYSHTSGSKLFVTNNMVNCMTERSNRYGIACTASKPGVAYLYHNSIFMPNGSITSWDSVSAVATYNNLAQSTLGIPSPAHSFNGQLDARNNVIRVEQIGAKAWQLTNIAGEFQADYNTLSTSTSSTIARIDDVDYLTLQDWKTSTGQDVNSFSQNPFNSHSGSLGTWTRAAVEHPGTDDLHFTSFPGAEYLGLPLGLQYDIDGDQRSLIHPTIGADELAGPATGVSDWMAY